ncbi:hypothetical protein RDWZM_002959 [Blomia tropicalis]|uniref:Protein KTI12 homolog n=1 Tax=Blomia tropicalis TaxID=40697 RepID=A0A9Q0MER3_BLOTA|nr:kti12, chromatin associated [Blomia tropicalis]KAJ6224414.1 hypothetical protein RDWZM_002959 [Blomia tropicalis]
MPLVVICGTPLSGKSFRAKQLYDKLTNDKDCKRVVLITDEDRLNSIGPNRIYKDASQEKELRSWLKSQVQRDINMTDTVVILDAANYIKGYRYELHCVSKENKTTHVVIECLEPPYSLIEPNLASIDDQDSKRKYTKEIFTELIQRFEKPDQSNRWDSPLFSISYDQTELPFDSIKDAILRRSALKPNFSTQSQPITTDNFLYELDSQTQDVIKQIQIALQLNQLYGIKVKNSQQTINANRKIPIAELNKLRRQFINYTRLNPFPEKERIVTAFVQFINKSVSS